MFDGEACLMMMLLTLALSVLDMLLYTFSAACAAFEVLTELLAEFPEELAVLCLELSEPEEEL